jgi:hypothetical protein
VADHEKLRAVFPIPTVRGDDNENCCGFLERLHPTGGGRTASIKMPMEPAGKFPEKMDNGNLQLS